MKVVIITIEEKPDKIIDFAFNNLSREDATEKENVLANMLEVANKNYISMMEEYGIIQVTTTRDIK